MSVGFGPRVSPEKLVEHHLWTLTKDTRRVECRVRMVPFGPDYPLYYNGAFLRSEVVRVAEDVKQQWIARGGSEEPV